MSANGQFKFTTRTGLVFIAVVAMALAVFRITVFEPIRGALDREQSYQAGRRTLFLIDGYVSQFGHLPNSWNDLAAVSINGSTENVDEIKSSITVSFRELATRENAVQMKNAEHETTGSFLEFRSSFFTGWKNMPNK